MHVLKKMTEALRVGYFFAFTDPSPTSQSSILFSLSGVRISWQCWHMFRDGRKTKFATQCFASQGCCDSCAVVMPYMGDDAPA